MVGLGPLELLIIGALCFLFLGVPVLVILVVIFISRRDRQREEDFKQPPVA